MRTHLGCTGSVDLGLLAAETQRRLEQVEANWLEYSPEPPSLTVRHVQPDDVPALREIAGELLEFLHTVSDEERAQIPGGALYYLDEPTGQYIRLKVWKGGFLTVTWAQPDYTHAQWEQFRNQPVSVVFDPFQRLNGSVSLEGSPAAADNLRKVLESTAGQYSQGDYEIAASVERVELTLRDVNADVLTLVNTLRYSARNATLAGEIDISSFRAGDLEDYCRFVFRAGETWIVRPALWSDALETAAPPLEPLQHAA
ncbi:MAG: hypothetical protein LAO04_00610 [Acidobacteriia bacterium]|nr:hypothetical protein [Terriglobia bacterium]